MKKVCYLFPGQGAQYVGMGMELYEDCAEAKAVFDEAECILPDLDIKRLCFEGPIERLTQTANSQVAIFVVSMAALKALDARAMSRDSRLTIAACAGLSLGELTALAAAGSINFRDGLRLIRRRGELMEDASSKNPGSMASIIGFSLEGIRKVCSETGAEIANLNCPGQIVISGTKGSVRKAAALSVEKGAKKAISLNVSGGFHSSLMKEAASLFKSELEKTDFSVPEFGVVSNVTADYEKAPGEIKENLVKQLYSPVRWEESIKRVGPKGIDTFLEIGPGRVLKGLLRRIDSRLKVYNIERQGDIDEFLSNGIGISPL